MTVGERLKSVRTYKGLTQAQLGELIFTNRSYISRVEGGFEEPTKRWILLISSVLDIDFNWLMYGESISYVDNSKKSV